MFEKLARFFIENSKLTFVILFVLFLAGIGSYFAIPKQYNPKIDVPAFSLSFTAPGLTTQEMKEYITDPLEDTIMELEGIDTTFGVSGENTASVIATFEVGMNKNTAKILLLQKIEERLGQKPIGVEGPFIRSIDPDDLAQITFALFIKKTEGSNASFEEREIFLRKKALEIRDSLRAIAGVTTFEIVGGLSKDIIIELDLDQLAARGINIADVYYHLKNDAIEHTAGNFIDNGKKQLVRVAGTKTTKNNLEKIIITQDEKSSEVLLKDIAHIRFGTRRMEKQAFFSDFTGEGTSGVKQAIFMGVGKKEGTNSVVMTKEVSKKLKKIQETWSHQEKEYLGLEIIQDEGQTAQNAVDMLSMNLIQSVVIVFFVLGISLGFRNALNAAIAIPLTLFVVFFVAFLFGQNINRITLFALILVLGMLVDDSTVVVENINRHLKKSKDTLSDKKEAIITAISEVKMGVILSTFTRLLAFGAMLFVTGMMGAYMGPIPWFGSVAFIASTLIALTINPWVSFMMLPKASLSPLSLGTKKQEEKKQEEEKQERKTKKGWYILKIFNIKNGYLSLMKFLIQKNGKKRRFVFKVVFWISLFVFILVPILGGVFNMRMLPKSDQNQIYLWIDAPRDWELQRTKEVYTKVHQFFQEKSFPEKLGLVKNMSATTGQAFVGDFANLFRGGGDRVEEHQLSFRMNLFSHDEWREKTGLARISSEKFSILIRPYLREFLRTQFGDETLKIRLLEDPPGPPTRATLLVKLQGDFTDASFQEFSSQLKKTLTHISHEQKITDLESSQESEYSKQVLEINQDRINENNLNISDISAMLDILLTGKVVDIIKHSDFDEPSHVILTTHTHSDILLEKTKIFRPDDAQMYLDSLITKISTQVPQPVYSDEKISTQFLYAEIGENSVIYPVIKLYQILTSPEFLQDKYRVENMNFYGLTLIPLCSGCEKSPIIIQWGGEWEITIDTFRDLGLAMIVALLGVYFMLVGQFSSFRVAGIVMIPFLLGFFGIFPGFSLLYIFTGEYFSATAMIGVIALAGIVVGNAILIIEYTQNRLHAGDDSEKALLAACRTRFIPVILTSITTILGATTILGDPVWSGLAWAIICGLSLSSLLTLIIIPVFYSTYLFSLKTEETRKRI